MGLLREKAAEAGVEPSVWQGDMTAFAVERAYELAICPFNTLQNLLEIDQQRVALDAVYDALASGDCFVFDVFVPRFEYIATAYGEWRTQTVEY